MCLLFVYTKCAAVENVLLLSQIIDDDIGQNRLSQFKSNYYTWDTITVLRKCLLYK